MKKIALTLSAIGLATLASAAQAQRPDTNELTGAQVHQLIQNNGAIVLSTGNGLYDRYVANASFCGPHEKTKLAYAPTSDSKSFPIGYTCSIDDYRNRT